MKNRIMLNTILMNRTKTVLKHLRGFNLISGGAIAPVKEVRGL